MPTFSPHRDQYRRAASPLRKLWGAGERDIRVSVLARSVRAQSEHLKLFPSEVADQDRQLEVLHGICGELLALDRRHGLEATGLLRVDPVPPEGFKCPPGLAREPFSLTDGQAWTLMVLLLDSLRIQGAMTLPEPVHPDDASSLPAGPPARSATKRSSPAGRQPPPDIPIRRLEAAAHRRRTGWGARRSRGSGGSSPKPNSGSPTSSPPRTRPAYPSA